MSDEIQKTALRLPKSLHEAIHAAAKESGRTMNAEIVYRLQQSFEEQQDPGINDIELDTEDRHIKQSDSKKLKGLLARMMEIVDSVSTDEAREIVEENETYERRAELDKKTEQSNGNESVDERYKDNPEWGRFK